MDSFTYLKVNIVNIIHSMVQVLDHVIISVLLPQINKVLIKINKIDG